MNVRFYLSYDIKITLKSHFCRNNVLILSLCMQRCYGRHSVSQKSVNHYSCIETYSYSCFNSLSNERKSMFKSGDSCAV